MAATNLFLVTGRLGSIELASRNGSPVCYLSVATNRWWYDDQGQRQEVTDWHRITFWGKLADAAHRNLGVGDLATVQGAMRPWSAEKDGNRRYGVELRAEKFERLLRKRNGESEGSTTEQDAPEAAGPDMIPDREAAGRQEGSEDQGDPEDIPF